MAIWYRRFSYGGLRNPLGLSLCAEDAVLLARLAGVGAGVATYDCGLFETYTNKVVLCSHANDKTAA